MNTRNYISFDKSEMNFTTLPEENEKIFQRYMEFAQHIRELDQLYRMMIFNLENIFERFTLNFDDRVFTKNGEVVDPIKLNAMLGNAISSGRTLIESMEVCDKVYISEDGNFKKYFIAPVYDECPDYRIVDFLRNYMQHGHVPVSYDGQKIFLNLSEILDVTHMRINARLNQFLGDAEKQLLSYGAVETRLSCVVLFYKYFLMVHKLYRAFYSYASYKIEKIYEDRQKVLQEHPEYVFVTGGKPVVPVYLDELGQLHGFLADEDYEGMIKQNVAYAQERLQDYIKVNGQVCSLQIEYCLEYRIPELLLICEENLTENLVEYCKKHGHEVRYVSFGKYYKSDIDAYTRHEMFPYIEFEDGVEWNVPYDRVTIQDFLRTFPETEKTGICVQANNMGGDGSLGQMLLQGWQAFFEDCAALGNQFGIHSAKDAIDTVSRWAFCYDMLKMFNQSFGKKIEKKPSINQIREYIQRRDTWNLLKLSKSQHASVNLVQWLLIDSGYISGDGETYQYNEKEHEYIKELYRKRKMEKEDSHGTQVDCRELNEVTSVLNTTILYYAIALRGKTHTNDMVDERLTASVEPTVKSYEEYLFWNETVSEIKIKDPLPEGFTEETEKEVCEMLRSLNGEIAVKCEEMRIEEFRKIH